MYQHQVIKKYSLSKREKTLNVYNECVYVTLLFAVAYSLIMEFVDPVIFN
jgi:hypothetical protein